MTTLAEHYYKVGNDMKMRAADMDRTAEMLLGIADRMSEEAAQMARKYNEADKPAEDEESHD